MGCKEGQVMTCKGANCTASESNGYKHSSECRFEYARNVASGINSVSFRTLLPDAKWRQLTINYKDSTMDISADLLRIRCKLASEEALLQGMIAHNLSVMAGSGGGNYTEEAFINVSQIMSDLADQCAQLANMV